MKKVIVFSLLGFISSIVFAQTTIQAPVTSPTANTGGAPDGSQKATVSVKLVRDYPVPQVFFNDLPGNFYIPTGGDYNRIMGALNTALSRKIPVNITFDKKSKMITDIDAPRSGSASGSLYDDVPDNEQAAQKNNGGGAAAGTGALGIPGGSGLAAPKAPSGWPD